MLFFQIEFIIFITIVLVYLYRVRSPLLRKVFLLAASYYFYAYWDYRYLSLIIISSCTDYFIGLYMSRTHANFKRKILLITSLIINLGILGIFKYYNFFIDSFQPFFEALHFSPRFLEVILPIGISFYTFQTLSYTIDLYRGQIKVCRDPLDFFLFVAFFPQLVAGPIVRARTFLPQLTRMAGRIPAAKTRLNGVKSFTIGLFLKVFVADNIARFVDPVFENPSVFDSATVWLSVMGYTLQIYFDFSGYSFMAIGLAKVMGFKLPKNFNFPYISTSVTEFWRRWHISLSTWFRDYLYIPLGGNRRGSVRMIGNLFIVMLLCGLWHGASWNFVFWGGLHGVGLILANLWRKFKSQVMPARAGRINDTYRKCAAWLFTLLFVMVGWIFFRAPSFEFAYMMLRKIAFIDPHGINWLSPFVILVVAATLIVHLLYVFLQKNIRPFFQTHAWLEKAMLMQGIMIVLIFKPEQFTPFVYFQF